MSLLRNIAGLALGVTLLGAVAVAQNDDIPLGDVAREQSGKKATHTYDDDNFQRSVPPPAADTAKSGDSAKDAKTADKGDQADAGQDDVKALEKQLAELQQRHTAVSKSISGLEVNIKQTEGDVQQSLIDAQGAYKQQLAKINDDIAATQKKLDAARAAQKPDSGEQAAGDNSSKPDDSGKSAGSSKPADSGKPTDAKPDDAARAK